MNTKPPLTNSKYEDLDLIVRLSNSEVQLANEFETFFREGVENYKRLAGHILSNSDLNKLRNEGRPAFQYNLFLPLILQLVGNFKGNQTRVEATPVGNEDYQLAEVLTKVMDHEHYTVNDLDYHMAKAFLDASVMRIGWVVNEWSYKKNPLGDAMIKRYFPFRIKYDTQAHDRELESCNFVTDSAWYSLEELQKNFAFSDPALWDELSTKAGYYIMPEKSRYNGLASFIERIFGSVNRYLGRDQGYDEQAEDISDLSSNSWYNGDRGLFKVVEYHERRTELRYEIYDSTRDMTFDITDSISASKDGRRFDNDKLQLIRQQFTAPKVKQKVINQIYQTAIIPALNVKLFDQPYEIQNGYFKYVPVWCYDFGADTFDNKSVVDHLIDPISSYNKRRNSILEYLIRLSSGETWVEEDALGEHEDDFLSHEIGGIKYVKRGAITGGKIQKQTPSPFPAGLHQFMMEDKEDSKYISGIRDNAQGGQESASESGRVFALRVRQSDIMQEWIHDNAVSQLKIIGALTKDMIQKHMTQQRIIRITTDEGDEQQLMINFKTADRIINDLSAGEYDVRLSKSPYGKSARYQAFNELMAINQQLGQLNPAYIDPVVLIKASSIPFKQELLKKIMEVDQQQKAMMEQQQQMQQQQLAEQQQMAIKDMELKQRDSELKHDADFMRNAKLAQELAVPEQQKEATEKEYKRASSI